MAKVRLITGSGNGLGLGHRRSGAGYGRQRRSRSSSNRELAPLVAQYGERVKPVTLEVRDCAGRRGSGWF